MNPEIDTNIDPIQVLIDAAPTGRLSSDITYITDLLTPENVVTRRMIADAFGIQKRDRRVNAIITYCRDMNVFESTLDGSVVKPVSQWSIKHHPTVDNGGVSRGVSRGVPTGGASMLDTSSRKGCHGVSEIKNQPLSDESPEIENKNSAPHGVENQPSMATPDDTPLENEKETPEKAAQETEIAPPKKHLFAPNLKTAHARMIDAKQDSHIKWVFEAAKADYETSLFIQRFLSGGFSAMTILNYCTQSLEDLNPVLVTKEVERVTEYWSSGNVFYEGNFLAWKEGIEVVRLLGLVKEDLDGIERWVTNEQVTEVLPSHKKMIDRMSKVNLMEAMVKAEADKLGKLKAFQSEVVGELLEENNRLQDDIESEVERKERLNETGAAIKRTWWRSLLMTINGLLWFITDSVKPAAKDDEPTNEKTNEEVTR